MKTCPNCGAECPDNVSFCTNCGNNVSNVKPPEQKNADSPSFCPKCGGKLDPGAVFCADCGTRIGGPAVKQPQQPQYQQQPQQPQYQQPYQQQQYQQPYQQYQQPYQQYQQPYQQYQQPYAPAPASKLNTKRSLLKFILLGIITFGIYPIVMYSSVSEAINTVASRYDGKKTMHFCLLFFIIAPLTLGIGAIVWFHKISNRIGEECKRRGIPYKFGASDFWIWNVLLAIIIVGPFIYVHKLLKATNLICADYNEKG